MTHTLQRMVLTVVAGVIAVGCASTIIPMPPETTNAIKNRNVTTARGEKPHFLAASAGKAMFGLVGLALMESAGDELVAQNNIDDPAIYIGEQLSQELAAKYGVTVSSGSVMVAGDDVRAITKNNPSADLVLEVRTTGWGFMYHLRNAEKYRVMYSARLRFIDVQGGRVVAEGNCSYAPEETPSSPTYDELLANGAERLRKELTDAADFCVGEFKTKVFRM